MSDSGSASDRDSQPPPPSTDMAEFKQVLRGAKNIIAVCGAGLSAASGMYTTLYTPSHFKVTEDRHPDVPGGRGDVAQVRRDVAGDARGVRGEPGAGVAVLSLSAREVRCVDATLHAEIFIYAVRARAAEPNAAHTALARFSIPAHRRGVAPDAGFALITQNVDGLSVRALDTVLQAEEPTPAGVAPLLEMHGRIMDVSCTMRQCGHVEFNAASPICAALGGTEERVEAGTIDAEIAKEQLPRCSRCGGLVRPGVVWFGEMPRHLGEIDKLVEQADLCLVVGTSSTVYPAAGYAAEVQEHGGRVAVFNLERSDGDEYADFLFLGPCEKSLPEALGLN